MRSLSHWLTFALAAPAVLAAQQPAGAKPAEKPDTAPHKPSRLFRSAEPVEMWLQADFKTVFKDRDTSSAKTTRFPAVLRFLGDKGDTVSLDVQLATRGSFRLQLQRGGCDYPGLKVYFDKEKTKGTLFGGEGSLKLSTHCRNGDRYTQNTYIEYAIYPIYNLLTPVSLRARLAEVHWTDPQNPKLSVTRPAFWLQDDDDMAKTVRGQIVMQERATEADMDERQAALMDVFQYMIGNTDFSLYALHNIRIVRSDTSMTFYPMAYDFDMTGMVDAPYQRPDYRLPIKRVTDRLYRGCSHPPELFAEIATHFLAKKDSIYGVLRGVKGLTPARVKEAETFLDDFFKMIGDPKARQREFNSVCQQS